MKTKKGGKWQRLGVGIIERNRLRENFRSQAKQILTKRHAKEYKAIIKRINNRFYNQLKKEIKKNGVRV